MGCIFVVSAIPGTDLPHVHMSDKLIHAAEYGVLALLLCRALRAHMPTRSRYFIMGVAIVASMAYGVSDEAHQLVVAQRTSDLADLAADSVGACLAAWGWVQAGTYWEWVR
jgi:VanZ family protein